MANSYCCHDHIVLLVSQEEFDNPPSWLSDNFHIIEGGTHKGGSSKNKLIIFSDGTYLELFTWIDKPVEFLDWAEKPLGLIDFALTTLRPFTSSENHKYITKRIDKGDGDGGLGVKYLPPKAGGRKRMDGMDVKWEVTRPEYSQGSNTPASDLFPTKRGDAPFFCHDITARVVRVPFDEDDYIKHPCGATGIAAVEVLVPASQLSNYASLYASITGSAPEQISDPVKKGVTLDLSAPTTQASGPVVRVRVSNSDEDERWLKERGIGIREVALFVGDRKDHGEKKLGTQGPASTISLIW